MKTRKKKTKAAAEAEDTFPANPPTPKRPPNPFGIKPGSVKGWRQAHEVLDTITSVSTIFPGFNRAVGCGGLPVRRITTIHGPTHGGKTALVGGFLKTFADAGFLTGFVDAEHAAGREFITELVANELEAYPNFVAERPKSYEETIAKVDSFLSTARKIRKDHPNFRSLLVVDSINKLVPERELKKLLADGSVSKKEQAEEMTKGHHGRYRAAVNQAWLDHLTPKIADAECALVLIAQEREEEGDGFASDNFSVKGGAALLFDASLVIRVFKSSPVWINPSEKKSNDNIAGFAHRIRIWKSKVGHMEGRYTDGFFYFSNGKITPPGIDLARDAFEVACDLGVIVTKPKSSWYTWKPPAGASRRKQGANAFVAYLAQNPERLEELMIQVNDAIEREAGRA